MCLARRGDRLEKNASSITLSVLLEFERVHSLCAGGLLVGVHA